MIVENRHSRAHFDKTLTALVFALAIFGVIAVSVATYTTSSSSDAPLLNHIVESTYSMRQFVFLMLAPFVVAFIYNIPYDWLRRRATLIYYGGTALLVIVLLPPRPVACAHGWISSGALPFSPPSLQNYP